MKMLCGFYKSKKSSNSKKPEPIVTHPLPSRVDSTILTATQRSPYTVLDAYKLECFRSNEFILQNYLIMEKIGGGSFGEIYKVKCLKSNKILAMKIEKKRPEKNLLLLKERQILLEVQKEYGFPHINAFIKGDVWSYLVMSHLGLNLETLRKKLNSRFSLKTVLMVGYQLMERIETLHSKNFLHRDIKPENFVIGSGENYKIVYIIDFGLSKSYMENDEHIAYRDHKGMVGTARYASINTHLGIEQSRRDDLEAIGYILIYLVKGRLPWQNIFAKNKEQKYAQILNSKQKVTMESLCSGLPNEFIRYFEYTKKLEFTAKPDYNYLKKLFLTMMKNNNYNMDYEFDWLSLYSRNSNSNSSMEIQDDNTGNKITNYVHQNKNPNNIEIINFGSSKKLMMSKIKALSSTTKIVNPLSANEKAPSSLTSSNNPTCNECNLKEDECELTKIQETYNTMKPKLIRNSAKNESIVLNFRKINPQCHNSSDDFYVSMEETPFKKV